MAIRAPRARCPVVPGDEGAEHDQQPEPDLPHAAELGLGEDPPEDVGGHVNEGLAADEGRRAPSHPRAETIAPARVPLARRINPPLKGARRVASEIPGMAEGRPRHEEQEDKEPDKQREAPHVDDARSGEEECHGATVNEKVPSGHMRVHRQDAPAHLAGSCGKRGQRYPELLRRRGIHLRIALVHPMPRLR